jgi:hypothetical protein
VNDIEFLDSEPFREMPQRAVRSRRKIEMRLLLSCVASLIVVVSMWLPQLSIAFPHANVYQVNAWGQYSIARRIHGESHFSISGSAPAVGAAAFAAALLTFLTAIAHACGRVSQPVADRLVLVAAGAIASSCVCQMVERRNFGPYDHWRWGLSVFAAGAVLALFASLWPQRRFSSPC